MQEGAESGSEREGERERDGLGAGGGDIGSVPPMIEGGWTQTSSNSLPESCSWVRLGHRQLLQTV